MSTYQHGLTFQTAAPAKRAACVLSEITLIVTGCRKGSISLKSGKEER